MNTGYENADDRELRTGDHIETKSHLKDCRDLHELRVGGAPLVPADHWGRGCPMEEK